MNVNVFSIINVNMNDYNKLCILKYITEPLSL